MDASTDLSGQNAVDMRRGQFMHKRKFQCVTETRALFSSMRTFLCVSTNVYWLLCLKIEMNDGFLG